MRKKLIAMLLVVASVFAVLAFPVGATDTVNTVATDFQTVADLQAAGSAQLTSTGTSYYTLFEVNMRASANPSGTLMARIPKGKTVYYQSETTGTDGLLWTKVTYSGMTGYIRSDLICRATQCYYTNTGVNLRVGPSTSYSS